MTYSQNANPNPTNSEMDSKTIIKRSNLTNAQRDQLIEQFVELQTDSMDMDTMIEWIQDILTNDYAKLTESELKERVDCFDDDGLYDELVDNIVSTDEEKEIERLMEYTNDDIIVIDSPNSPLFP